MTLSPSLRNRLLLCWGHGWQVPLVSLQKERNIHSSLLSFEEFCTSGEAKQLFLGQLDVPGVGALDSRELPI